MRDVGVLRWVRRSATRQFTKRILRCDMRMRLPNGRMMVLPQASQSSTEVYITNANIDWGAEALFARFADRDRDFIDIGAHAGYYSVYLSPLVRKAYAFEPDPRNLPGLNINAGMAGNIEVVQMAVSSRDGRARFDVGRDSETGTLEARGHGTIDVAVTSLDSFLARRPDINPALVKTDVEGHDFDALCGMNETVARFQPLILTECSGGEDLLALCAKWNYAVFGFVRGRSSLKIDFLGFSTPGDFRDRWCKMLFLVPLHLKHAFAGYERQHKKRRSLRSMIKKFGGRMIMRLERMIRGKPAYDPATRSRPESVLFLQFDHVLGAPIHVTPLFEALKKTMPGTSIAVACWGMAYEVFRNNPFIDILIPTPNPYTNILGALQAVRRAQSAKNFYPQCTITTSSCRQTRLAMLALAAGGSFRLGFTLAPELYHKSLAYDPKESLIFNNLRIVEELGGDIQKCEPRVLFTASDLSAAKGLLAEHRLDQGRLTALLVTQASGHQPTSWRAERFIDVARHLADVHGAQLVFTGAERDAEMIDRMRETLARPSLNLAGRTPIPVLSALTCLADLAVTLDTGTMHIGRATQLPMVIIATAWQKPVEWLPLNNPRCTILRGPDIPRPPAEYRIDEVRVDQVCAAIDGLLTRFPPSPEARRQRIERCLTGRQIPPPDAA